MGWLDNLGQTLVSAAKGIVTGKGSTALNSEIQRAGSTAGAAANIMGAGQAAKAVVAAAGGIATAGALGGLSTSLLGKISKTRLGSSVTSIPGVGNLVKSGLDNINVSSLIAGINPVKNVPSVVSNPFSPSTATLNGGNNISPGIQLPKVVVTPPWDYKTPPDSTTPPPPKKGVPLWGWVAIAVVVLAALGVSAAKKITGAIGLKF